VNIVYSSFFGRYSDSPRAVYEALASREGLSHVWLADPAYAEAFPPGLATVPTGGPECVQVLESADVIVTNHYLSFDWTKRPDTFYLQTWHGTPLKRLHNDGVGERPTDHDDTEADVARWDALLSPNPHSSEVFPRAFGYSGVVAETGSPRNDVLTSPHAGALRDAVRRDLGIADGVTAVLYTPTWRDDDLDADGARDFALHLDLQHFSQQLGRDHVLLMRLHYLTSDRLGPVDVPGVVDVSRYPDVADLYLAADVMVTDYSSTMFDFAVTGKPMLLFAYDLEHYRDRVRGFYLDLATDVPAPLLTTTPELVQALRDLPSATRPYRERYAAFRERFCRLDDGGATQRVVDRFFPAAGPRPLRTGPQTVILAAGMGTRLGRSTPKPLTPLADGTPILHHQIGNLRSVFGPDVPVTVVVGYRAQDIRDAASGVSFAENEDFATTNTSKSLQLALETAPDGGVLWLNGDVVFDAAILEHVRPWLEADVSFVCVNTSSVAEEEIKYTLDDQGYVRELSKTVVGGLGEAVGINYVSSAERSALVKHLGDCADGDYFERGMETAVEAGLLRLRPLDISAYAAVEVDVEADLVHANGRLPA